MTFGHFLLEKKYKQEQEAMLDELRAVFTQDIMEEFNKVRKPTIEEMVDSHTALKNKYENAVEHAKIFGIDLHSSKFEKLLKGRLFEICMAEIMTKNLGFRMLEWTPDKGFDRNIKVESNKNPDLILADTNDDEFAVECKYIGMIDTYNSVENAVAWVRKYQAKRYIKFSNKRNMPVFIALGITGEPSKPDIVSVPPIEPIIDFSFTHDFRRNDEKLQNVRPKISYVCKVEQIEDWIINLDNPELPWLQERMADNVTV